MRYLGLDIGSRHIGVAVGEVIATELTTLTCKKNESIYSGEAKKNAIAELQTLLEVEEATAFVIGLPVNERNEQTEESQKILAFASELEKKTNCRVHFVNETLTSFMAQEMLEAQGVSESNAKERVHQVSAQLILQQFLEENAVS
jgi:putative Holliday junction resolvase